MDKNETLRCDGAELLLDGDLLVVRAHGMLQAKAAQEALDAMQRIRQQYGHCFVLVDLQDAGGIPAGLRRYLAQQLVDCPPTAVAFFGANLWVRAVNELMVSAIKLLAKKPVNVKRFETEAQARAWLADERHKHAANLR